MATTMTTVQQKAREAVARALKSGELTKPSICEWPDGPHAMNPEGLQAHHEDYARPLDVVWLCAYHHVSLRDRLDAGLRLRLTSAELRDWKEAAKQRNVSVSALVRDAVALYLGQPSVIPDGTEARASLKRAVGDLTPTAVLTTPKEKATKAIKPSQCPRAHTHRPGSYCHTCDTLFKKP